MRKLKYLSISLILIIVFISFYNLYPQNTLGKNILADSLVIYKDKRILQLWSKGLLIKSYKISLGKNPIGHKEVEGDKRTPEGIYYINDKNPNSNFYKNLGISYPNQKDIEHAKKLGKNPGGQIKIHGLRKGFGWIGKLHRLVDWTSGCIAMTGGEIDELYDVVKIGTRIIIYP